MNESKYIKLHKGRNFVPMEEIYHSEKNKNGKIFIFDLDETLGSFSDLYILWKTLEKYIYIDNKLLFFHKLFDLYPEFLRHGILNILEFLYYKKQSGECSKIYIYTNNQCNNNWVEYIIYCIESKIVHTPLFFTKRSSSTCLLQYYINKNEIESPQTDSSNIQKHKLFDDIIQAFKIGDKKIELKRTTHEKTYLDFIKFTLLPKNMEFCFIDNNFFPKMCNENVYYIQPRSYFHYLKTDEIIDRFISSSLFQQLKYDGLCFETLLYEAFLQKKPFINIVLLEKRLETDLLISQKLMYYIREFFYLYARKIKTKKARQKIGRFTRKKGKS